MKELPKKLIVSRDSCPEVFYKVDILKSFKTFTEKHLCWSFFLLKVRPEPVTFLKRDSNTGVLL